MKLLSLLRVASAAFFFAGAAYAQNPGAVTNHAFPIGKGAGTQGFGSLVCTGFAVGTGAGADPTCRAITYSDLPSILGASSYVAGRPLLGNGTSPLTQGTLSGNTSVFATVSGALPSGNCIKADASGNLVNDGKACGVMVIGAPVTGGIDKGLLYNNAGTLGNLATANNGVVVTSGVGVPSVSSTLPSGLSIPNPTVTGSFTATGLVTNADLVNPSVTVSGQPCALGSSCAISPSVAGLPVIGNGGTLAQGTRSGSTTSFATTSGALTPGNCLVSDASHNITDLGSTCGGNSNSAHTQVFVATTNFTPGTTAALTLSSAPTSTDLLTIYFDGVAQATSTWSLASATVTFGAAIPLNTQLVEARWFSSATLAGVGSITAGATTITGAATLSGTDAITLTPSGQNIAVGSSYGWPATGFTTDLVRKVRQYGPTPQDYGASGSDQSTTGTISSGSATLTLAAAIDFGTTQPLTGAGQGIRINHAGAASGLNVPTSISVTPQGTAGSTTYTYTVVAIDSNGGTGAAATSVATTTGNAVLNTTNFNRIAFAAPVGGSTPVAYAIYGRIAGSLVLRGFSITGTYDDHGGAAITNIDWLPTAPPGAALARWLVTTISSGAGSTTLTLAATASTSATSQTVIHDDTAALNNFLFALGNPIGVGGATGLIPAGVYLHTGQLTMGGLNDWNLNGQGKYNATVRYAGSSPIIDLWAVTGNRVSLTNFRIDSIQPMLAGTALHLFSCNFITIDLTLQGYSHGTLGNNLWNALWLDRFQWSRVLNSNITHQNDGIIFNTGGPLTVSNLQDIAIGASGAGLSAAGGTGGLYLGQADIFGMNVGIGVTTSIDPGGNSQFFVSNTVAIDSTSNGGIYLDDNVASNKSFSFDGWSSSSGLFSGAAGHGITIVNFKNGNFQIGGGAQLLANRGNGIYYADPTVTLTVDAATAISSSGSWGIFCSVSTNNVYSDARSVIPNVSGDYSPNCNVEVLGNPGARKFANGYILQSGTVAGTSASDTTVTLPIPCPNTVPVVTGNISSNVTATTVMESLSFHSISTTSFIGYPRSISGGSGPGRSGEPWNWQATCK